MIVLQILGIVGSLFVLAVVVVLFCACIISAKIDDTQDRAVKR